MINIYEKLVDSAIFKPFPFSEHSAWLGHIQFADFIIRMHRPKEFVELGSHWGHSYFAFCQSIKENAVSCKAYAIDTWQGDEHAGHYGEEVYRFVNSYNEEHYQSFSRLLKMKFDDAVSYFPDESVDLLHIDGLHTYAAVKHDFDSWLPKLSPGAIVLFHDINVRERDFGVWKFWEELCDKYPNNIGFSHSHGLGVLQLPGGDEACQQAWLSWDISEKEKLVRYFSSIGHLEQRRFELLLAELRNKDLQHRLDAEKKNAVEQINYRDDLISNLKIQLVAEKTNASEQIS